MAQIPKQKGQKFIEANRQVENFQSEEFEYKGELYDLIYESMDPNTNKMVVVNPPVAKEAIKKFIESEIGSYMEGEFKILSEKIDTNFMKIKDQLESHIKNKIDTLAEDIASELISSNFKEKVNKKVEEKLGKIKDLL